MSILNKLIKKSSVFKALLIEMQKKLILIKFGIEIAYIIG
ncbi:hypothetical protein CACET_c04230 [Clostridium aceticum]|uniref:Uncharacterized protein n=1 Tax=Clostridium aceticum TaxID=84022 RepID=A0A0G3W920_9CLOT|nr:hypothetical protein CACET_c04230 [Clostridium aceticum]